ncbi:MAG: hypothetical protein HN778_07660 [Prolixibacteraceae bacterium]|jgi:hypothetical protein|nr:hypothetical protein [Prolixibacteraceae bacterium]MBT6765737.1 hypothetical protein [Prolixibacteraceae bacterium]MBT6999737.1 hypothetical protein [Prolixibacteraceae bacterium]MBT7394693.1 hypothetical protein [Prolixibacteraceae bacterium]
MLSNVQINFLAEKINEKVNLPLLGEEAELALIKKAIYKVLDILEDEIPDEFVDFLEDTALGFDPEQGVNIELVKTKIVTFVNEKVDLPILGEETEKKIFSRLADVLIDAMTKGNKLGN